MNDRALFESLKAGDPGALAACYDECADDLFRYCWFMLRDREAARVALRDTLVAARAHIGRLKDPGLVWPWLHAMARAERRRRRPAPADHPDVTVACPDEPAADLHLTGWNAVMALPSAQREALYLSVSQDFAPGWIALVLGIAPREAGALLDRAGRALEQGVVGEILARAHGGECAARAAILGGSRAAGAPRDQAAGLDGSAAPGKPAVREALARHAARCGACSGRVPHRVSAAKVFSVLPVPEPLAGTRLRTMTLLTDPELAGYRALVARRSGGFTQAGFPVQNRRNRPGAQRGTPRAGLWAGLVSGAAAVTAGAIFAMGVMGRFDAGATQAQQHIPAVPVPGGEQQAPAASSGPVPGGHVTPIRPLGSVLPPGGARLEGRVR